MKKICCLAACLLLFVSLTLPALATDFTYNDSTGEFSGGTSMGSVVVTDSILENGSFSVSAVKSGSSSSLYFSLKFPREYPIKLVSCYANSNDVQVAFGSSSSSNIDLDSLPIFVYSGRNSNISDNVNCSGVYVTWGTATTIKLVFSVQFTPDLRAAIVNDTLSFADVFGIYDCMSYEITEGVSLVFSNVVGSVKACTIASNGSVVDSFDIVDGTELTYDDVQGVVYLGRPDVVYNSNYSSPYSFSVAVADENYVPPAPPPPPYDFEDGVLGIVGGLADSMFSIGSNFISWATTGTNFIVLIPLCLFVLVAAILFIRKLIKGV